MGKYFFLLLVLGSLWSCKEQKNEDTVAAQEPEAFSIQDFPEIIEIAPEVAVLMEDWEAYTAMETSFAVLKRATNTEDLKLAIDDLIEKEKALADSDYPSDFDKLQIKSRQQVFRTFLFKVKGNLMDNRAVDEGMEEMINAYNSYKNQFNILSGKVLDPKLILNEK